MSGTLLGSVMASKHAADGVVVYRTVQTSPGLMGRTVGPLFASQEAAMATLEAFAEEGLNADPTTWDQIDDCGTLKMVPSATRHSLVVEPVVIHGSADEVLPSAEGGETA